MRYTSLFVCVLALCGCKSAEQIAAENAAYDSRVNEIAKQRAEVIKMRLDSQARLLCEHSLNKRSGTPEFDRCYKDAYNAKLADEREALQRREEQRQAQAAQILSDFANRHGSVNCYSYYGFTQCNY